jgi:hypothetical protein
MLLKVALLVLLVAWTVESSQPRMVAAKNRDSSYVSYHALAGIIIGTITVLN